MGREVASMFSVLGSYAFFIVALSTSLLAGAAAILGALSVLQKQSLIADALGHASYPGVVLAFMLFTSRDVSLLLLGAGLAGCLACALIQGLASRSQIQRDNLLAIMLSGFFGLGLVLKSYIQGNSQYQGASQAGLRDYIFGQAAFLGAQDARRIALVALVCLLLLWLFYRPLRVFLFDPSFAHCLGYRRRALNLLILLLTVLIVTLGLRSVGAILMSSLFIAPITSARLYSQRLGCCLGIAAGFGALSALGGSAISSLYSGLPTGPAIVLFLSTFYFLSLLLAPRGVVVRRWRQRRAQKGGLNHA